MTVKTEEKLTAIFGGQETDAAGIVPEQAAAAAERGFAAAQAFPAYRRSEALAKVSELLARERETMARLICEEVKKPLKDARREVDRSVFTFKWASEEARRCGGEWMPLDFDAAAEGRLAVIRRFARGPALLIAPFNFPLNLVAHKVAPAMAVGTSFTLKPPPQAPKTALALGRMILEAGYPAEAFSVLPCSNEAAEALVKDERYSLVSFTGSAGVGWRIKAASGKKHVLLELGGNGAVIVGPDADLPWAAARCAWGGFAYSGQVCISVQRVFVHDEVYDEFKELFLKNVAELKAGDPSDESTDVGPLINEEAARRVEAWIAEAKAAGAKVLVGGPRRELTIPATVLEKVPADCRLACEEAFGPVVTLDRYQSFEDALSRVGSGRYGLQAGVFTHDIRGILGAWNKLRIGGIIVNDVPTYRSDAMPYGGAKDSGLGREGVRFAMDEFTEPRTLVLKP